MGFALLAWLVLLYLFSSRSGWFACLLVLLFVGILLAWGADEREPRQQCWRGSLRPGCELKKGISPRANSACWLERLRALRSEWLLVASNASFESTPSNGKVGWRADLR